MTSRSARSLRPSFGYDAYDVAAALLLAGVALLALLTVRDYAISNDEPVQQRYGELIIAYYASGFTDRALFGLENLYLYGGLFDVLATLIAKAVPLDIYYVRHLLCAAFGIGGIAATWASARLIAGPRAGLIAATLIAVSGVWYGGMFNHTKDITFAAAMMGATYALVRAWRDLPRPRVRDVLLFGAMLGAALGLRAPGLLLGVYLAFAILLRLFDGGPAGTRERLACVGRSIAAFVPGLILGYLIMIAAWPWSALSPLNPVRAIIAFADFHYPIRDLLAGTVYRMEDMPRSYLPIYLAIKLPLVLSIGAALALWFAFMPPRKEKDPAARTRSEVALLGFAALFPVACQVIARGPEFSGMRHFMFVVPPLAALAGIGLDALLRALAHRRAAAAAIVATIAVAVLWNAAALVRLHPHQYLYYNPLVGGLPGAAGRYATDYWANTMPEAIAALDDFLARTVDRPGQPPQRVNVAVCADRKQFEKQAPARMRWTDIWEEADFFISPTHMVCDTMLEGKVIATVERVGVVLGVVKDRRAIIGAQAKAPGTGAGQ